MKIVHPPLRLITDTGADHTGILTENVISERPDLAYDRFVLAENQFDQRCLAFWVKERAMELER